MKVSIRILIVVALSIIIFSCKSQMTCTDAVEGKMKNLTGLDGCSWVIELEDGRKLEPINLKEFDIPQKNNQKVYVSYKPEPNYMSICMVGPIVRIICIEKRK